MFAIAAFIAFVVALILNIVGVGADWVTWLTLGGLALVSAHLAWGNRFMRRM